MRSLFLAAALAVMTIGPTLPVHAAGGTAEPAKPVDANYTRAKAMIQAFEKRLFEQGYQQPLLWWHRIVPTHKVVMGWKMSPSHNLGADLADVWLQQ